MPARTSLADAAPLTRASLAHPLAANVNGALPVARDAGPDLPDLTSLPVGVLLDALADRVVDRLLSRTAEPRHPEHASARENPLGSARAFLDAGRRGDFPTFKRGREVVARWVDVLAYIERRAVVRTDRSGTTPSKSASSASTPIEAKAVTPSPAAPTPTAAKPITPTRTSSPAALPAAPKRTAPSPPAAPPAATPATQETPDDRRRRLLRAANLLPPGH